MTIAIKKYKDSTEAKTQFDNLSDDYVGVEFRDVDLAVYKEKTGQYQILKGPKILTISVSEPLRKDINKDIIETIAEKAFTANF